MQGSFACMNTPILARDPALLSAVETVVRRILCVFPKYAPSFGTFEFSYPLTDGVRAFMPPQGLLVIAAALPKHWDVRFIDENIAAATDADFAWADAVLVSGMHVQRRQIDNIRRRAHAHDKVTVLGGSSVSACPDYYPAFDYLHVGEMGDAFDALVARLAVDLARPAAQVIFKTVTRVELSDFPIPAYDKIKLENYFIGSIQFSSGCPYQCEFCDIPGLYGRVARLKTPEQIIAELDVLLACGLSGAVYFVDDNLIANRRALRELLPHLVAWQKRNGYAIQFACEATLNIARRPELLEQMREAAFNTVFCGIETPDAAALTAMGKDHNMQVPILEAIGTLNSYGIEVVSGIILGLDTDTPQTGADLLTFIEASQIPMLTINLLEALPQTPLWDRLVREQRLVIEEGRESNVDFRLPYDDVLATWRACMAQAYQPAVLFARYEHQIEATYKHRLQIPPSKQRASWRNIKRGLTMLANIFWRVGVLGDYRAEFWRFAWRRIKTGDIESLISVSLVAHHLITFARQASSGAANASHYSTKLREVVTPAE